MKILPALLIALTAAAVQAQGPSTPTPAEAPAAVVLELFTAQGCSSCPPADDLARRLSEDPQLKGRVVVLGYHVDYWNYGGWTDPFSAGTWTDRQKAYAKRIPPGELYTPQMVVNGERSAIGSDERVIRQLIAAAQSQNGGRVQIQARRDGSKVIAEVVAAAPPGREGRLDIQLAVIENGLETAVAAGENAHRTLRDDFVVRRLQRIGKVEGAEAHAEASVRIERGWKAENLALAVFLQDPDTRAIAGATSVPLPR